MKGVDLVAHEDPSVMQNATLSPIPLLQRSPGPPLGGGIHPPEQHRGGSPQRRAGSGVDPPKIRLDLYKAIQTFLSLLPEPKPGSRGMKGVNLVAHEDPSVMQNVTLNPFSLLQRSLELVGPIYGPLLILASPGFVIPIVAELIPLAGGILNLAYGLIGAPILAGAAFWLVDQHLKQRTPPLGNSLDRAVSRAVPLVFGSILLVLIVSLGMLLFVLPGIYWGVRLAFTLYAIVLEDKGATEGLGYSWNLVRGRWWGVFWAFLAVGLIFGIAILISFSVGGILGATLGAVVVRNAVATAVAPIFDIYTVLLFRSLQQLQAQAA